MKRIRLFSLLLLGLLPFLANTQPVSCVATVETFPLDPQSGSYNYFGIKVTLNQSYDQDVIVKGFIYDLGSPNTNTPFAVTVTAGNTTDQTSATFYQTTPSAEAFVQIDSLKPYYLTKNNVTYEAQGNYCGSYTTSFASLAEVWLDSSEALITVLDNLIDPEDQFDFFDYVVANGISAAASQYSLTTTQVEDIMDRSVGLFSAFGALAQTYTVL